MTERHFNRLFHELIRVQFFDKCCQHYWNGLQRLSLSVCCNTFIQFEDLIFTICHELSGVSQKIIHHSTMLLSSQLENENM